MKDFNQFILEAKRDLSVGDKVVADKNIKLGKGYVTKDGHEYKVRTLDRNTVTLKDDNGVIFSAKWQEIEKHFDKVPN